MKIRKVVSSLIVVALITANISSCVLPVSSHQCSHDVTQKINLQLQNKIQRLKEMGENTTLSLIIWLMRDQNVTDMDELKNYTAALLTRDHAATVYSICKVLPVVMAKLPVQEIERVAMYDFIESLGDGNQTGTVFLDVSKNVVRANYVNSILGCNGSEVTIAILDTGINSTHPDLNDFDDDPATNDPKVIDETSWVDPNDDGIIDVDPMDYLGHGTHVAGIAAGTGEASNYRYVGVAPGAWLMNVKVAYLIWTPWGPTGTFDVDDVINGIDHAMSQEADIINLSLGARLQNCSGTCDLCMAVDFAVDAGVVVVAAAGNDGPDAHTIACPGAAFDVITVGASDDNNTEGINDDNIPWWSSRGPTGDGRGKPEVVAPGVNIVSSISRASAYWQARPNIRVGDFYAELSGTSMATPHVAGVAALLLQAHPGWTPDIVKSVIMGTARLNDNLQQLTENDRGKGIVDAERALTCPTDIPTDDADNKSESGFGIYVAQANLNGTYGVVAETVGTVFVSWADAVLYKSYTPEEDVVNPIFDFGFHDAGMLTVVLGSVYLDAKLKLWEGEDELFAYQERIHTLDMVGAYTTDCFHTISYQYEGVLLAGHTYDIEYGFYAYAITYVIGGSVIIIGAQALSLSILDILGHILGPGNPSFEQRLQLAPGVWGVPYWSMNNDGWRELRGDIVEAYGKVNMGDLSFVARRFGSYPGHPNWDSRADLNGDEKINMKDIGIVTRDMFKGADRVDGAYSWYTSGGGDYTISQWLCDYDVNALKGKHVDFTFWFKPKSPSSENQTRAEIYYINGTWGWETEQAHINGTWVPLTETDWNSASVTATLPDNTLAIKVIIHGQPNFIAWIDNTSISIQY